MTFTGHNVTIEARAFATPVNNPEIEQVIDLISGEVLRTTKFIAAHRYGELVEARVAMREATKGSAAAHLRDLRHAGSPRRQHAKALLLSP